MFVNMHIDGCVWGGESWRDEVTTCWTYWRFRVCLRGTGWLFASPDAPVAMPSYEGAMRRLLGGTGFCRICFEGETGVRGGEGGVAGISLLASGDNPAHLCVDINWGEGGGKDTRAAHDGCGSTGVSERTTATASRPSISPAAVITAVQTRHVAHAARYTVTVFAAHDGVEGEAVFAKAFSALKASRKNGRVFLLPTPGRLSSCWDTAAPNRIAPSTQV